MSDFTIMLAAAQEGQAKAAEDLLKLVYDELRRLAAYRMAQQAPGQTLQPTALVHEAWLKLVGSERTSFADRSQFFAAASACGAHGGDMERVEFDELELAAPLTDEQMLDLHEALDRFTQAHPVQAKVVKLRFFVGMTHEEIAQLLALSVPTVKNYWSFSRAWLFDEMEEGM